MSDIIIDNYHELLKIAKFDHSSLIIEHSDNIHFSFNFPLKPDEFIIFAQNDFSENSVKGNINALANAKRCIDCLIETTLRNLYIDPNKISDALLEFCNKVLPEDIKNISPHSLRAFCALNLAPSILISEVRLLRNKVEHEYTIPKKEEVAKAIEVAELLVNNVEAKVVWFSLFSLTDRKKYKESQKNRPLCYSGNRIIFDRLYDTKTGDDLEFVLTALDSDRKRHTYYFKNDDILFYHFLRFGFTSKYDETKIQSSIKEILSILGSSVEKVSLSFK